MSEIDHLYAILQRDLPGVDRQQFRAALEGLESALAGVPTRRTQLTLRRLRFRGEKRGDFRFFPGVNVLRAGNDKGKSSILKLIHFCLTGRNELKKDVDGWIDFVELYFELDGVPHAVEVRKSRRPKGRLLRCDGESPEDLDCGTEIVAWNSGRGMQQELETFFNDAFGLRPLAGTQKDSRKRSDALLDAPTSYRAYFRGLYVNQHMGYTDLVTDGIPYGNLFYKVVGMLLGLRGIEGHFAVEARRAHVENRLGKEERYHRRIEASLGLRDLATLDEEIARLGAYIDDLKSQRAGLVARATAGDLDRRLRETSARAVEIDGARATTSAALELARRELEASERAAAAIERSVESRDLLDAVGIGRWPGTEVEPTTEQRRALDHRRTREAAALEAAATKRLQIARRTIAAQRQTVERRRADLRELDYRIEQVAQQTRYLRTQLRGAQEGTGEIDRELEIEIRYLGKLEAEREIAARVVSADGGGDVARLLRDKALLDTVLRHLRSRDADSNERRKQDFARRVQEYCTTIGFPGLEDVSLDAQLRPRISQNGRVYGFDELSPGEKVRFVLAFYLALAIVTALDREEGAHPGLLLIDSPGKEEMVEGDFEAVVRLLSQIEMHHPDQIQVLVATAVPAIRGATRVSKQYFVSDDTEPVFD